MSAESNTSGNSARSRGPGRPAIRSEEANRRVLVEAAIAEFGASGFAKTSIEAVARRAGMSTRTIYKFISNKSELFEMALHERVSAYIATIALADDKYAAHIPPIQALGRAYAMMILNEDSLSTIRMIIAEADQFPQLVKNYNRAVMEIEDAFRKRLLLLCEMQPNLNVTPADIAMLRTMILGAQRQFLLSEEGSGEVNAQTWADQCTEFFLRACRR